MRFNPFRSVDRPSVIETHERGGNVPPAPKLTALHLNTIRNDRMNLNHQTLETPVCLAGSTAMFGLAFRLMQDGVGLLPILAAFLGGAGTFLMGVAGIIREYRSWREADKIRGKKKP